ncbi:hypothetical protein [Zobellella sp. An-6]|uniref:hypothetical protein n=1 Tax=Zobellella sp. An-6 TaxID=3400218 RepID=UPI0040420451
MSIWKELYDIFDKERARWQSKNANRQALIFEIQSNLTFLADALQNELSDIDIAKGLERKAFDKSIESGFSINSISKEKVTARTIGDFDEFKKYIGKDTEYLVKNAYSKTGSLLKITSTPNSKNHSLKFKSLFRFLMLLVTHIEGRRLIRHSSKSAKIHAD